MKKQVLVWTLLGMAAIAQGASDGKQAPALLPPDPRYKADLLLVVAHPDDDTLLAGYLAKLVLDEHKRVSVVYCTSGTGGGNSLGYEAGLALGEMRVIEARRALASIGIENVWFLGAKDTAGQNVLWSLDSWGHGRVLDEMVRLVRLTRPEVVVTWLPDYVVGENHGDHQAAGVVATEAFDEAGDPLQFPEQVAAPRDRTGMNNLTEGLQPWQAKKLYYQTDAFEDMNPYWDDASAKSPYRKSMLEGTGPSYDMKAISRARGISYAQLFAIEQSHYGTQGGDIGKRALAQKDWRAFEYPAHLIFGKSLVGGAVTGDVFEHVRGEALQYVRPPGLQAAKETRESGLEMGGSWAFYREFWKAHAIEHLAELVPVPEMSSEFGQVVHVPLLVENRSGDDELIHLEAKLPEGWKSGLKYGVYPVGSNKTYPVGAEITAPESGKKGWQQVVFEARAGEKQVGKVTVRVYVGGTGGLPQ